jgi:hypothetical protein
MFGASISVQGVPVKTASDNQKVIDTRWLTLDIFQDFNYSGTFSFNTSAPGDGSTIGYPTAPYLLYNHQQGFLPAYDYIINTFTCSDPTATVYHSFYADTNNVYYAPELATIQQSVSITLNITIRMYTLPITQTFNAPNVQQQATSTPNSSEFGVEFINPQYAAPTISNASINQFNFTTQLRPLNILATGVYALTGYPDINAGLVVIPYNHINPPLYMIAPYLPNGFKKQFNFPQFGMSQPLIQPLGFSGGRGKVTSKSITIGGVQGALGGVGAFYAYILLKDPLTAAQ